MIKSRIFGIDCFRLAAAFSVILLHVGNYSSMPPIVGIELRLLGRWAVPFFFIVSGYFAAPYISKNYAKLTETSAKSLVIFFISNILFLPLSLAKIGPSPTLRKLLSFQLIFEGMHGHLWFLSSLTCAMLVFYMLLSYEARKTVSSLVIGSLIILVVVAYYPDFRSSWKFARYLTCFPFIYMGFYFRLNNFNPKVQFSVLMICLGFVSQTLETYLLYKLFGISPFQHDFLLGTIPFAVGMFLISLRLPESRNTIRFAEFGMKYSLGIYIFHPYFIYFLQKISLVDKFVLQIIIVPFSFFLTLTLLIFLDLYYPFLLKLISANPIAIKKVDKLNLFPSALTNLKDK